MNGDRDWQTENKLIKSSKSYSTELTEASLHLCFQTLSACGTLDQLDTSNSFSLLLFLLFFTSSFESIIFMVFFFLISSDLFPGCMPKVSHKTLRNPVILSLTSWTIRATVCLWQKGHLNKKSCFHRKSFMYQAVVSKCSSKRMNRAGCPNATTSRDLVTCVVS